MSAPPAPPFSALVGQSPALAAAIRKLERALGRVSRGERERLPPVLLLGETGTGKGLLASEIHRASARTAGRFVHVNCAAIPETLMEAELFGVARGAFTDARESKPGLMRAAHHGTLFLDEVALLPPALQAKLLIALEERTVRPLGSTQSEPIDILLVAASHVELSAEVKAGRFRPDLYHRLAVITVTLPPLRERGDDIGHLAHELLARACADYGLPAKTLAPDALAALRAHPWPGNVRELSNAIERAVLTSDAAVVEAAHLEVPSGAGVERPASRAGTRRGANGGGSRHQSALEEFERARLAGALREAGGSVAGAAAKLGLARSSLRYRLARLGLDGAARSGQMAPAPSAPPPAPAAALVTPMSWEQRYLTLLRATLGRSESAAGAAVLETLAGKARAFGGHIEEVEPTGLVAVFGAGEAAEGPSRAGHAAMAMARSVEQARAATPAPGVLKIGLLVRAIMMARVDGGVRLELESKQRALGDLDTMLAAAPDGAVVTDPESAHHLARRFRFEPLAGAPAVHRLAGAEPAPADATGAPFVGRQREMLALHRALGLAADGAHAVALWGEAGMGKSRLLAEFQHGLAGRDVAWLEGHCVPSTAGDPYAPLVRIVRRACGLGEDDAGGLAAGLKRLGVADERTEPILRHLLGLDGVAPALDGLAPPALRERIHDALATMLLHTARARTTVLVLEDVHWMDEASRQLLRILVQRLAGAPVVLVLTARPGTTLPWLDARWTTRIDLPPLARSESLSLLRSVLAGATASDAVVDRVLARADGNPLFLEELGRQLRDRPGVRGELPLPGTIREILQIRIDGLGPDSRALLDVAAVLGVEFAAPLWEGVWGGPLPERELAILDRLDLIEPVAEPGRAVRFRHALIQETAYAMLGEAQRRALHRQAGAALERLAGGAVEIVDRLAYHYARSGDVERAVEYLTRFAAQAARFNAPESVAALHEALTCIEQMPEGPEQERVFLRFLVQQGDALPHLADLRRGKLDLLLRQRARVDAAANPAVEATYYLWLGRVATPLGEFELAVEAAERTARLAAAAGDRTTEGAAHAVLAHAHSWLGRGTAAVAAGRRAVLLLEGAGDARWLGYAYRGLALAHIGCGEMPEVTQAAERLAAVAVEADSPFLAFSAIWMGAFAEMYTGSTDRALAQMRRALEAASTPFELAQASGLIGVVHVERGEAAPAIALLAPLVSDLERLRQPHAQALFASYLAEAHRMSGDLARARQLAQQAKSLGAATRYHVAHALATRALGRVASDVGETAEGERLLAEAIELFESVPCAVEAARTRAVLRLG